MTAEAKDHWSSEAYQKSASFVPKLATKVMGWLDPQPDDVILDIGCGDGILDVDIAQVLAQGKGKLHGIDSSKAMIDASVKAIQDIGWLIGRTVCDALNIINHSALTKQQYNKVFSNAAMHWILKPRDRHEAFFRGVRETLQPGGVFVFEMGGLGNVCEMVTALLLTVGRRIGLERTVEISPWFFGDEEWARTMMEETVGGWKVEKVEREWRPTTADEGGVDGWIRLMGAKWFEAIEDEKEREDAIHEAVKALELVCKKPDGGFMINYVRLRVMARKI
ncbi:hypothetical protein VMCG_09459 [Cytospora schulzeri]|uniref:Methyltransferase domain-containing protein n=1 Tax=Cytospora schulzeri TaxID=448051 RepID=A0A423VKG8_9PEZI|nr:hypothetical protein VMCG_09459 [Valsa malicola]